MSRLTKKSNSILKAIEYQLIDEKENLDANEGIKKIPVLATNKLGRLEDIEEELGIDLITLFEILEQGYVYTTGFNKRMEKWYFQCIEGINKTTLGIKYLEIVFNENEDLKGCVSWVPDWKDYGKTWSLDKQTLEK